MRVVSRTAILILIAALLSSCLSGSKVLVDVDASGRVQIEFEFPARSSGGYPVKHLLIDGMENTRVPYSVELINHGPGAQEVSWQKKPGSDEGGVVAVAPGETKVVVVSAVGTGCGTGLSGLTSKPNRLGVTVRFESPLPEGTRLRARLVWADGP